MMRLPFRELLVWQKSLALSIFIYEITKKFPKEELFGLTSQMRRSAASVPTNIAEGSQRSSDRDYANFLLIAKGSLAELLTQVFIARGVGYLSQELEKSCIERIEEVDRMLRSLHHKVSA